MVLNRDTALIGAAGLLAFGAWWMLRDSEMGDIGQEAVELFDTVTGMKLSNMGRVTAADVSHRNVQAFLKVIRRGEGTSDAGGYKRIFGGELFSSFADHPRKSVTKTFRGGQTVTSTAAGAYQFLASTWDETARIMGLSDFSPRNQDWGAVGRIAARGALDDVKAGNFDVAIKKIAREWASMPGSPYGQPVISMDTARSIYASAGGMSYA